MWRPSGLLGLLLTAFIKKTSTLLSQIPFYHVESNISNVLDHLPLPGHFCLKHLRPLIYEEKHIHPQPAGSVNGGIMTSKHKNKDMIQFIS